MKNRIWFLFLVLMVNVMFAQKDTSVIKEVDSLYKEDQFYVVATYNFFGNKPKDLTQSGFSFGLNFGFIKDMPINKNRHKAIGIGLAYAINSYNNNLLVRNDSNGSFTYNIIDNDLGNFTKNKLIQHVIELPIEYRWRTSTPVDYNFWRIYTGFKFGYALNSTTKFEGELGDFNIRNNNDFNNFQYGLTFSAGYNTWNLYGYYGLNPIFSNNAKINDLSIGMNAIKIGLIFYIL